MHSIRNHRRPPVVGTAGRLWAMVVVACGLAGCTGLGGASVGAPLLLSNVAPTATLRVRWVMSAAQYPSFRSVIAKYCRIPGSAPRLQAMLRPYGGMVIVGIGVVGVAGFDTAYALVPRNLPVTVGERVQVAGDNEYCQDGNPPHVTRIVSR